MHIAIERLRVVIEAEHAVVRIEVRGLTARRAREFFVVERAERFAQRCCDLAGDPLLDRQDRIERQKLVIAAYPELLAGSSVDQARSDADSLAVVPDGTGEQVVCLDFAADGSDGLGVAFIACMVGDHEEVESVQANDDFFGQAEREVSEIGITDVLERHDEDPRHPRGGPDGRGRAAFPGRHRALPARQVHEHGREQSPDSGEPDRGSQNLSLAPAHRGRGHWLEKRKLGRIASARQRDP